MDIEYQSCIVLLCVGYFDDTVCCAVTIVMRTVCMSCEDDY